MEREEIRHPRAYDLESGKHMEAKGRGNDNGTNGRALVYAARPDSTSSSLLASFIYVGNRGNNEVQLPADREHVVRTWIYASFVREGARSGGIRRLVSRRISRRSP